MGSRGRFVVAAFAATVALSFGVNGAERQVVGYIEDVRIFPGDLPLKAKIDTGAKTSSIDVRDPVKFEREGREWVRFKIKTKTGESGLIERPVLRKTQIRRAETETEARYVINLGICLGGYFKQAEVNLNNRAGMGYRFLIGRLFLGDRFLIDSSKKNLTTPNCPEAPGR
ncbi:MAG: ATP-dependent zinc protease [Rhodospirillales bacterium]|nr:ATP-dependent zinc protease [Rhodospirillales bacterium]